ncbi:outer membrane beta-barrel protein [Pedobacter jeongneungensis]|uniref:outer membrane beta-barrel protein n=1 Tax=Pedobacter jeongneungensis TaxID=947309 RepID=UPI00046A3B44|nr:outer membrane beta-barrel protein [Pedobacter jeongneungensis]
MKNIKDVNKHTKSFSTCSERSLLNVSLIKNQNLTMRFSKLLLLICLFSITTITQLQAQIQFGIKGGANLSSVSISGNDERPGKTQFNIGSQFGINLTIPLAMDIYLQPGFTIIDKGYRQKTGGYSGYLENFKTSVTYLEIPINIQYRPQLGNGHAILGIGAYAGYGTGGNWKADNPLVSGDIILDNHGKVIFREDLMDGEMEKIIYGKKYDYGLDIQLGYDFSNKLWLEFNPQIGLRNLLPEIGGRKQSGSQKNYSFALSVGYKF